MKEVYVVHYNDVVTESNEFMEIQAINKFVGEQDTQNRNIYENDIFEMMEFKDIPRSGDIIVVDEICSPSGYLNFTVDKVIFYKDKVIVILL